jgi:endoglucanase
MPTPLQNPTAATLSDGRVLVVGTYWLDNRWRVADTELYDPARNAWSPTAPLSVPASSQGAAALPGDRALVLTWWKGTTTPRIYDGRSNTWSTATPMLDTGGGDNVSQLSGGRVLVAGGGPSGLEVEVYDSSANRWSWATPLGFPTTGDGYEATMLGDGRVMLAAAAGSWANSQIYDPKSNTWSYEPGGFDVVPQAGSGNAATLGDGNVLVLGSLNDPYNANIYDPQDNDWWPVRSSPRPQYQAAAAALSDGDVLVVGGMAGDDISTSAMIFAPPASYPTGYGMQEEEIDGSAVVGSTLTATAGAGEYTYQWQRCSSDACVNIGDPSAPTYGPSLYQVVAADVGDRLQFIATAVGGTAGNLSDQTAAVQWPLAQLERSTVYSNPSAGPITISVIRNGTASGAVIHYQVVPVHPLPDQLYPGGYGTLSFAPGQDSATVSMPVSDHGVPFLEREFQITLFDTHGVYLTAPSQAKLVVCSGSLPTMVLCGSDYARSPLNPLALKAAPPRTNPLAGAKLFVDTTGTAVSKAAAALKTTDPAEAAMLDEIVDEPDVTRFGRWSGAYPGQEVQSFLERAEQEEPAAIPMLATYELVHSRLIHPECGHWADPPATQAAYHEWITNLAEGIGAQPAVLFLEMDSLITVGCLSPQGVKVRMQELHDAINVLQNDPHLVVYLDAGAADAAPAAKMARLLRQAGIAEIQGFFLNSTHFDWTSKEIRYGEQISKLTGGKHFVINTAENGQGPLIPKHRASQGNEVLCNPVNRGLGPKPATDTGYKHLDAFAWIANPGVSGGSCRPGVPPGLFSVKLALGLVRHADFKVR